MENKLYPKQYQDIYSVDNDLHYKLDLDDLSGTTMDFNEFTDLSKDVLRSFYSDLFTNYVKVAWLRRNFLYKGRRIKWPINKNPQFIQIAFVKYLHRIVGMDIQILTRSLSFSAVESYFNDFFPGFEDGDPFKNPEYYKFPYKNISIDFLVPVCRMDERLALLKDADKRDLTFAEFRDSIINEVLSINAANKKEKYDVQTRRHRGTSFFVKKI